MNPGAQPWLLSLSSGLLTADWKLARQASPHPLLQLPQALMLPLVHSSTCQSVLGPPILTPQPEARPSPGPTGTPPPAPPCLSSTARPPGSQAYLTLLLEPHLRPQVWSSTPKPLHSPPRPQPHLFPQFSQRPSPFLFQDHYLCVCVCRGV